MADTDHPDRILGRKRNAAAQFALMFLRRKWFEDRIKPSEGPTFATLLLTIYEGYQRGLLMTKKDAGRAIAVEHLATVRKYVDLAVGLGVITIEPSEIDRRAELLVPTEPGMKLIEKELERIAQEMEWGKAHLDGDYRHAGQLLPDLQPTGYAPRAELLSVDTKAGQTPSLRSDAERRIAVYSETLRLAPENYWALYERTVARRSLGDYDNALADVQQLIQLRPKMLNFLAERAGIYRELGDFKKALADCERVLSREPRNVFAFIARAKTYQYMQKWELALSDFDSVLELQPNHSTYLLARGQVHEKLGHLEKAVEDLIGASQSYPSVQADIDRLKRKLRHGKRA